MSDPDEPTDDLTSEEAMRWAADEPTAMWDSSALETEGFEQLVVDRELRPREATGPATAKSVGGSAVVTTSSTVTGGHAAISGAGPRRGKATGMSWALTFGLALGLGVVVYFVVSALR